MVNKAEDQQGKMFVQRDNKHNNNQFKARSNKTSKSCKILLLCLRISHTTLSMSNKQTTQIKIKSIKLRIPRQLLDCLISSKTHKTISSSISRKTSQFNKISELLNHHLRWFNNSIILITTSRRSSNPKLSSPKLSSLKLSNLKFKSQYLSKKSLNQQINSQDGLWYQQETQLKRLLLH